MYKTQEYLQNKHKNISLFQHHMFFPFRVVIHPIRDQKDGGLFSYIHNIILLPFF